MQTIEELRVENLRQVMKQRGWTIQDLADAVGRSHSQISQVLTGAKHSKTGKERVLGSKLARVFEGKLGLPHGSMDVSVVEDSLQTQAQSKSLNIPTVEFSGPKTFASWREFTMTMETPETFRVQLPDNSMGRRFPKGMWIVFDRAQAAANRRAVAVRVDGGEIYFRRVKEVDGGWIAKPDDEDFAQFDSRQHKLEIIATMRHAEVPDEEE